MKQNLFDRSLYNDLKTGAYYTDADHAYRLGQMFEFSSESCVLEPCFGDAKAVEAFLKGTRGNKSEVKKFGVEMNPESFESAKDHFDYALNEDFLKGVRITPKAFSLIFTNPPYGECNEGKDRLETEFLKRFYSYLMPGGILVLIIPRSCMEDKNFIRDYAARFETKAIYRFDDKEYEKYHQYVFIATRRDSIGVLRTKLESLRDRIYKDQFPYIPQVETYQGEIYQVPETANEKVALFTGVKFDYGKAAENLQHSSLFEKLAEATVSPYYALKVGDPPLPLKKDLLYLAAIAGAGEGVAGREEDGDVHLQRGVVKPEKFTHYETTESGSEVMVETTKSVVTINLIDSFGNIRTLR